MVEVITFSSILIIIDFGLKSALGISKFIQDLNHADKEIEAFDKKLKAVCGVLEKMKEYLGDNEVNLDESARVYLTTQATVITKIIDECQMCFTEHKKSKYLFALTGKQKLKKLSQELQDWNDIVKDYLLSLIVISTAKSAVTIDQMREVVEKIRSDINQIRNVSLEDIIQIPNSLRLLTEQVNSVLQAMRVNQRNTIPDNDSKFMEVIIDKKEIVFLDSSKHYRKSAIYKRGDKEKKVMVETIRISLSRPNKKNELRKLALILRKFHPLQNILTFEGIVEIQESIVYFISDGSIERTLNEIMPEGGEDSEDDEEDTHAIPTPESLDRIRFAKEIASACEHLHIAGIYHHDLRSENIFVKIEGATLTPYLSGFTHAREFASISEARGNKINDKLIWEAPERSGDIVAEFTAKCEVYSFGMLLLAIGLWKNLNSHTLLRFSESENREFHKWTFDDCKKANENITGHLITSVKKEYSDLAVKCLKLTARDRPKFEIVRFELERMAESNPEQN